MKQASDPSAYLRSHRWVEENGGDLFRTHSSLEWFIRNHRQELIESGELIPRRGPGGHLIGLDFGRVALAIMQRQAGRHQGDAA